MRVLLRPVLVPELGLVVVKPGRESMPVFHNTRVSWWAVRNQLADALPEAVLRRSLGLPAEKKSCPVASRPPATKPITGKDGGKHHR